MNTKISLIGPTDEKAAAAAFAGKIDAFGPTTDIDRIVSLMREMTSGEMFGTINAVTSASLVVRLAERTELPVAAFTEDMKVLKRILSLNQGNDPARAVAFAILCDQFQYGCFLWRDPDETVWEFDGRRWIEISKERLKQVVADACLSNPNLAPLYKPSIVNQVINLMLIALLRGAYLQIVGADGTKPLLLNLSNGELWLNGTATELRPHRPWSGQSGMSDIVYEPDAKSPKYDAALAAIFAKATDPAGMLRHWHEFAGYAVQPNRRIASFWLLIGKGANGKSKLLDIIRKLIGSDGVLSEPVSRFQTDKFALSSLNGKRILIDDDVDEDLILGDGLIKKLSEEKLFTARAPYGRRKKEIISMALPVMAGNHYPSTRDVSPGMQRRTFVIPFERTFSPEDQQPELFDEIWVAEQSGILNHIIDGFLRVVNRGYKFAEPQDCIDARQTFFTESNPLRAFLSECCDTDPAEKTRLTHIRHAFREWAKENSLSTANSGGNKLKRNLELMGFKITRIQGYPWVHGLSLKAENAG